MSHVIFLNGSSSAGKTTLALKLQQLLPEPYQLVALDQFRDGMPERVRGLNAPADSEGALGLNVVPGHLDGVPVTAIEFGPYGKQVLQCMRETVALFVNRGLPVIVDDLLLQPEFLQAYAQVLNPDKTWMVGVRCAMDVVQQREASRLGRFPGTAVEHFSRVHEHGGEYDIEVDTGVLTPRQAASYVIDRMSEAPRCLHQLTASTASQS